MITRNTSKLLRSSSSSGLVFCIHPIPSPLLIPVVPPTAQQHPPKFQSTKHCLQSGNPNVRLSRLFCEAVLYTFGFSQVDTILYSLAAEGEE